jgi:hypothetical protein
MAPSILSKAQPIEALYLKPWHKSQFRGGQTYTFHSIREKFYSSATTHTLKVLTIKWLPRLLKFNRATRGCLILYKSPNLQMPLIYMRNLTALSGSYLQLYLLLLKTKFLLWTIVTAHFQKSKHRPEIVKCKSWQIWMLLKTAQILSGIRQKKIVIWGNLSIPQNSQHWSCLHLRIPSLKALR